MKKLFAFLWLAFTLVSCGNNKNEKTAPGNPAVSPAPVMPNTPPASGGTVTFSVDGKEQTLHGSILVQKDKDNVSPGNPYFGIITASSPDDESMNVNIMFDLKTGSYPVVGLSFTRKNAAGQGEVFGALLGGKPRITEYKVTLKQCEKVGTNSLGGNKWKISGTVESAVTIDAMGIMKLNKEHPASIRVDKISFADLVFDDNWDEMMNKLSEGMKKRKK